MRVSCQTVVRVHAGGGRAQPSARELACAARCAASASSAIAPSTRSVHAGAQLDRRAVRLGARRGRRDAEPASEGCCRSAARARSRWRRSSITSSSIPTVQGRQLVGRRPAAPGPGAACVSSGATAQAACCAGLGAAASVARSLSLLGGCHQASEEGELRGVVNERLGVPLNAQSRKSTPRSSLDRLDDAVLGPCDRVQAATQPVDRLVVKGVDRHAGRRQRSARDRCPGATRTS